MFWIEDVQELFKPILIPTDYMSIEDKLNTLTRLVIFICIIISLILQDVRIILLMIIIILLIFLIYKYQFKYKKEVDTFLNKKNISVVDNKICVKPTKHNPFMNPSLFNIEDEDDYASCPINNDAIDKSMNELYDGNMFRNADDIYDRTTSKRQFYTIPVTKIPNEQTKFALWLYGTNKTCKENNGEKCYQNIYKDLRL